MSDSTKRIKEVYDLLLYRHIIDGQEDLANALCTSRPNVTNMLNGKVNVSGKTLRKIYDAFPDVFNLDYLLTGEGELLASSEQPPVVQLEPDYQQKYIASLEKQIEDKDRQIEDLRLTIQLLHKRIDNAERWSTTQANFYTGMAADERPEPTPDK